jgi:hypothetical protein
LSSCRRSTTAGLMRASSCGMMRDWLTGEMTCSVQSHVCFKSAI